MHDWHKIVEWHAKRKGKFNIFIQEFSHYKLPSHIFGRVTSVKCRLTIRTSVANDRNWIMKKHQPIMIQTI